MKPPKIDLDELKARQRQNFKERLEFTKRHAAMIRKGEAREEETTN